MKTFLITLFIFLSFNSFTQTIVEYNNIYISDLKYLTDSTYLYWFIEYKLNEKVICHVDIFKLNDFMVEDIYINGIQFYSISYFSEKLKELKYIEKIKFVFKSE